MDSANIAPELVIIAAIVLVIAIPRLANSANMIDFTEELWFDIFLKLVLLKLNGKKIPGNMTNISGYLIA
jgi:hypothetical protein